MKKGENKTKIIETLPKKVNIQLAALNPFIQSNSVSSEEKEVQGKNFIAWGDDNQFPNYLYDLYESCSTLQSIINGTTDFITGDDVIVNNPRFQERVNEAGDTMFNLIQKLAADYLIFGGFALQVIQDSNGDVSELYWIDFSKVRSNKKNTILFFSEEWNKTYGRVKYLEYPKWGKDENNNTSIVYFKNNHSRSVYPTPLYKASIKSCEIEKKINDFHLNEISNNFLSSKIINFNGGVPDDDLKNEIEKNINEKFSGAENAGRILVSFNDNKESETTVTDLSTDDFADRYEQLQKRSREQIFIAFRATPNLFGLPTDTTGFNEQEFNESFKLYNKTVVKPVQTNILNAVNSVLGENTVIIKPFTLNSDSNEQSIIN